MDRVDSEWEGAVILEKSETLSSPADRRWSTNSHSFKPPLLPPNSVPLAKLLYLLSLNFLSCK